MWAFLVCMLTERFTHLSILQQAAQHPFNVVFLGLLISLASIIPKYTTGVRELCSMSMQNTALTRRQFRDQ